MRRKEIRNCTVPGCERLFTAKGYCSSHYEQWKRGYTDPEYFTPLPARPKCKVSGCDRPNYSKGGCRTHYDITARFNLSLLQLMMIRERGCEICGKREDIHVDHDHRCCQGSVSCGSCIRGGLCASCNMAIGALDDTEEGLKRAVNYLRRGTMV